MKTYERKTNLDALDVIFEVTLEIDDVLTPACYATSIAMLTKKLVTMDVDEMVYVLTSDVDVEYAYSAFDMGMRFERTHPDNRPMAWEIDKVDDDEFVLRRIR